MDLIPWRWELAPILFSILAASVLAFKNIFDTTCALASQLVLVVKNLSVTQETPETQVQFLGGEDPLEEEMATHSSILAWKILCSEESDGLQSMGSQRAGHS